MVEPSGEACRKQKLSLCLLATCLPRGKPRGLPDFGTMKYMLSCTTTEVHGRLFQNVSYLFIVLRLEMREIF